MFEYSLILLGGLLGSSHCIGMCGPLAISIGACSRDWKTNLARQSIYSLGRVFTYAFLGILVAFLGMKLMRGTFPWIQGGLSCLAGLLLILQGLHASGLWMRVWKPRPTGGCAGVALLRSFLRGSGVANVFFAGMLTGFLPCGLVYAYLALAASSGGIISGGVTMVLFGFGTIPLMISAGVGGSFLSLTGRRRLLELAGYCVLLTGVLTCYRGGIALTGAWNGDSALCPQCFSESFTPEQMAQQANNFAR